MFRNKSRSGSGRAWFDRTRPTVAQYRQGLLLILLGLAIMTVYINYRRQHTYELRVFTTSAGWGYTVLINGQPLVYQPTIPGRSGATGFARSEQARRVGERVIGKLRDGELLPTLTTAELNALGIPTPGEDTPGRSVDAEDTSGRSVDAEDTSGRSAGAEDTPGVDTR